MTETVHGEIAAESVLAISFSYGITAEREFSAVIASYGRKYPVSVSSAPPKSRMCFQMTHIELKSVAEKCPLQPKMSVTAENSYFRPKIPYSRNFSYGRISAFIELYVTVTEFRKKSSFGHTLAARGTSQNIIHKTL